MNEFKHLQIQLEEIKKATSSFDSSAIIGNGGFGKVYKGQVSHSKGRSMVAIKRLDRKSLQGDPQFLKEIKMLSCYSHKNLISLLGFCDEEGEKILVYELARNGSLDRHLSSFNLTWAQRIKICLDAAKGLSYLHDPRGTQQRVLHRDIKSANILLDHNWNAKLSDMGLSKLGPANQLHTFMFTDIGGTHGYCDPQYMTTYTLTKESDVYSFGVVLFEVLCGRLCFESGRNYKFLVPIWKECFRHKKLDEIIFKNARSRIDKTSLETLANIAFQCVHESREQRPKMSLVVEQLKIAFKCQERYEMKFSKKVKLGVEATWPEYCRDLISNGKTEREEVRQKNVKGSVGRATKDRKGMPPPRGLNYGEMMWWFGAMVIVMTLVVVGYKDGWRWVVTVVVVGSLLWKLPYLWWRDPYALVIVRLALIGMVMMVYVCMMEMVRAVTRVTSGWSRWLWAMAAVALMALGCNIGWSWVVLMVAKVIMAFYVVAKVIVAFYFLVLYAFLMTSSGTKRYDQLLFK